MKRPSTKTRYTYRCTTLRFTSSIFRRPVAVSQITATRRRQSPFILVRDAGMLLLLLLLLLLQTPEVNLPGDAHVSGAPAAWLLHHHAYTQHERNVRLYCRQQSISVRSIPRSPFSSNQNNRIKTHWPSARAHTGCFKERANQGRRKMQHYRKWRTNSRVEKNEQAILSVISSRAFSISRRYRASSGIGRHISTYSQPSSYKSYYTALI